MALISHSGVARKDPIKEIVTIHNKTGHEHRNPRPQHVLFNCELVTVKTSRYFWHHISRRTRPARVFCDSPVDVVTQLCADQHRSNVSHDDCFSYRGFFHVELGHAIGKGLGDYWMETFVWNVVDDYIGSRGA
jgi:hypothetical protein